MKKELFKSLFASAAMLMFVGNAATAQTKYLKEITSQNDAEYYYYRYNADNKVDSIYLEYPQNDMHFYRLYKYDEQGNQILEQTYTDMFSDFYEEVTPGSYIVTGYNEYKYDDSNRIISKVTYDLDFDSYEYALMVTGAIGYFYDENGRLSKETTFYDAEMTSPTETTYYFYDENGRIKNKDLKFDYYEEDEVAKRSEFTYDEQGRLANIKILYLDESTGVLSEYENISYTYDADGNLINRCDKTADFDDPILEYNLTYDKDIKATDVVFPINHEDETDFYIMSQNAVSKTEIYSILDYDSGKAELYDIQTWHYEDGATTGVNNVINGKKVVDIIVSGDCLLVKGIGHRTDIRIYDVNGNNVFNGVTDGTVNISNLPAGTYIATSNGTIKKFAIRK